MLLWGRRNPRLIGEQCVAVDFGNLASFRMSNGIFKKRFGKEQEQEVAAEQAAIGGTDRVNVRTANALEIRRGNLVQCRADLRIENVRSIKNLIPADDTFFAGGFHVN